MLKSIAQAFRRKEFFTSLGIWLGLQIVCLIVVMIFDSQVMATELRDWVYISLPLGAIGATLIGFGAGAVQLCKSHCKGLVRRLGIFLADLISFLGLIGVGFPLFICGLIVFNRLLSLL